MTNKSKKWLIPVLGLSLALNVFAGGVAVTHFMRTGGHEAPRMEKNRAEWRVDRFSLFANMGRLSPEVRQQVKEAMQRQEPPLQRVEENLKNARKAVREAMRAEPFDKAALDTAYDTMRSATLEFQEVVQGVAVNVIEGLDAEQRQALAERPRYHHKHGKK